MEKVDGGVSIVYLPFYPIYPFHVQPHGFFINRYLCHKENKFDIIHIHSPLVPVVKTDKPKIVTEHGTAKGFIDNLEAIDMFSIMQKMFSFHFTAIDRAVISNSNYVTAVSAACSNEISRFYNIQNSVDVVGNGVDTDFFCPGQNDAKSIDVLFVGSLITKKGLTNLIEAAGILKSRYPKIRIVLAGKGPLKATIIKLVKELQLPENVILFGYADRDALRKLYRCSRINVLPSNHEGLPTTILEAMACGIPVVSTPVGGIPEVVKHGETGLLVNPKQPLELANAISLLMDNREKRRQIARNALAMVKSRYEWGAICTKFESIYRSVLN